MNVAQKLLEDFYLISGMRVALYDKQARCVAWAGPAAYSFCNAVHSTPNGFHRCFASDEAAFQIVAKTQKTHTFTCPFGLFEAVTPILQGEALQGYLFVGEAILKDPAQARLALREGAESAGDSISTERLQELIAQLASHTRAEQQALVRTLELFAAAVAKTDAFESVGGDIAFLLRDYLALNYTKRITLSALARHFHYSTVTLTEHFKKAFGKTIVAFLTEKRIEAAKTLLTDGDLTISLVCHACGFENPEHFSKAFKKQVGLSPLQYRQSKRCGTM